MLGKIMKMFKKKKAVLHIGSGKAGSSSIQKYMLDNINFYNDNGYFFEITSIYWYAANVDNLQWHKERFLGFSDAKNVERYRKEFEETFVNNVKSSNAGTYIYSHEALFLLNEVEELRRLKHLLSTQFDEIRIIAYIRRQDAFMVSGYIQSLKESTRIRTDFKFPASTEISPSFLDYYDYLSMWREVFGDENVIIRPFERRQLYEGDVVADFVKTLKLPKNFATEFPNSNTSIDSHAVQFLRLCNKYLPDYYDSDNAPHLIRALETLKIKGEDSRKYSPPGAKDYLDLYSEVNEKVAYEFLGRRDKKLFYDAPLNGQQDPFLSVDNFAQMLSEVWLRRRRDYATLKSDFELVKNVYASSVYNFNYPQHALLNEQRYYWHSDCGGPQWWEVTLSQVFQPSQIAITPLWSGGSMMKDFKVQYFSGQGWTDVAVRTTQNTDEAEVVDLEFALGINRLRIVILSSWRKDGYVGIQQVSFN